jgi:hypothetical protein
MTLPANTDFSNRELATCELDAVSGGFHITFGGNPPRGDSGHGCHHEPHPHEPPPRYYPGGVPNDPALHPRY